MHLPAKHIHWSIIAAFIVLSAAVFANFFSSLSFPDSTHNFTGKTKKVKLDPRKPVTQTFVAKDDLLDQVRVNIGNSSLHLGEKLTFELAERDCKKVVASDTKTFFSLEPKGFTIFSFDAIPDSKNKLYCAKFTYASDEDRGDERPYIAADDSIQFASDSYTNTSDNKTFEGRSLQIRPSYGTATAAGTLQELNNRLSQYKPDFFKSDALTLILSLLLLGTLVLVMCLVLV